MKKSAFIIVLAAVASNAAGDVNQFIVEKGEWHDVNSWSLKRQPILEDHVVIPSNSTCTILPEGLATCGTFHIDGVLTIIQETLVIGIGNPDVDNLCTLNGRIELFDDYNNTPPARIVPNGGWVRIEGIGELYAKNGACRCCASTEQEYNPCNYFGRGFAIGTDVTMRGSWRINTCLQLDGTFIIDDDQYETQLGSVDGVLCGGLCSVPYELSGDGKFLLSAGKLIIAKVDMSCILSPVIKHSGGIIQIINNAPAMKSKRACPR